MNWIRSITEAYSESEAPQRFYYWCALSAMASVIKKNIWIDRQYYKLYTNIYVFIIATSGSKKGIPIIMAKNLIEKSEETKVISGRNSVPRILMDLGKMKTSEKGKTSKNAQATIISGELASLLVKDLDGMKILTDLYNTHEHEVKWENSLKSTNVDTLLCPCINILGATNDDHFAETIPKSDVKGGFIARTFIVYSTENGKSNSLVYPPKNLIKLDDFVPFLKELAQLKGEFKWTKDTGAFFDNWYNNEWKPNMPNDSTGTYNRIHDGIIKVAMLLSLSKNLKLEMDMDALLEAKAECLQCAKGAHQISMGGSSTISSQTRLVMQALLSHIDHRLSRTQLLRKYWGDLDSYTIDLVAETLLGAGVIKIDRFGKETVYTMKDEIVKEYLEYERRIKS